MNTETIPRAASALISFFTAVATALAPAGPYFWVRRSPFETMSLSGAAIVMLHLCVEVESRELANATLIEGVPQFFRSLKQTHPRSECETFKSLLLRKLQRLYHGPVRLQLDRLRLAFPVHADRVVHLRLV